jgi:hypothetical protein
VGGEVLTQCLEGVGLAGPHGGERLQEVLALLRLTEDLAQDVELVVAEEAVASEVRWSTTWRAWGGRYRGA